MAGNKRRDILYVGWVAVYDGNIRNEIIAFGCVNWGMKVELEV